MSSLVTRGVIAGDTWCHRCTARIHGVTGWIQAVTLLNTPCNKGYLVHLLCTRIQGSHSMSQHVMCVTPDVTPDVTRRARRVTTDITRNHTYWARYSCTRPKYTQIHPNTPCFRGYLGYLLYTRIQCSHSMSCVSLMMSPTMSPAHQKGHSGYHPESHLLSHVRLLQG